MFKPLAKQKVKLWAQMAVKHILHVFFHDRFILVLSVPLVQELAVTREVSVVLVVFVGAAAAQIAQGCTVVFIVHPSVDICQICRISSFHFCALFAFVWIPSCHALSTCITFVDPSFWVQNAVLLRRVWSLPEVKCVTSQVVKFVDCPSTFCCTLFCSCFINTAFILGESVSIYLSILFHQTSMCYVLSYSRNLLCMIKIRSCLLRAQKSF